jgi:hypothetical protein
MTLLFLSTINPNDLVFEFAGVDWYMEVVNLKVSASSSGDGREVRLLL